MAFRMVDMKRTAADQKDDATGNMPAMPTEMYPYGLAISLDEKDMAKLDLSDDVQVGDMIDIRAMGQVTSVSQRDNGAGEPCCRVEIQLKMLGLEEEAAEDAPKGAPTSRKSRYSAKEEAAEGE